METTTTNSSSTQQQLPQTQQITFPYKLLDGVVVCVCANLNVLIDTGSPSSIGNNISQFNLLGKTFNLASNFMGINLNSFTEQFGQKLDILLGTDVLSKFDFLIDSQRMSVTFWTIDGLNTANPNTTTNTSTANTNTNTNTNETNTNAETSTTATTTTLTTTSTNVVPLPNFGVCSDDTFTSVNMQYMIGVPVIGIAIPNRTLAAIFDTGSKLTYVPPNVAIQYPQIKVVHDFHPMGGRFSTMTHKGRAVIGGFGFFLVFGVFPQVLAMSLMLGGTEVVLGCDALQQHSVFISFHRNEMNWIKHDS